MKEPKVAIMVDEINAMKALHRLGVEGIRPWKSFYEALEKIIKIELPHSKVEYHIYGAIIDKELDELRYTKRMNFFNALRKAGIKVHLGYCVGTSLDNLSEKGVDVMLALDLYEKSLLDYQLLFVFSGDTDLVPAIKKAQNNGSKVAAILGENQPAKMVKRHSDSIVTLESILRLIPDEYITLRNKSENYISK